MQFLPKLENADSDNPILACNVVITNKIQFSPSLPSSLSLISHNLQIILPISWLVSRAVHSMQKKNDNFTNQIDSPKCPTNPLWPSECQAQAYCVCIFYRIFIGVSIILLCCKKSVPFLSDANVLHSLTMRQAWPVFFNGKYWIIVVLGVAFSPFFYTVD